MTKTYLADITTCMDSSDKHLTVYNILPDGEIDVDLRMVAKEPMATFVITTLADLLPIDHYTVDENSKLTDKLKSFGYTVSITQEQV